MSTSAQRTKLAGIIANELAVAAGQSAGELDNNYAEALRYYYGEPLGNEVAGHSTLLSLDLADVVEAEVAQMMPALDSQITAAFVPNGAADEDQAEIESRAVDDAIWQDNDGFTAFCTSIKDALLMRMAVQSVEMVTETFDTRESYTNISTEAVQLALVPEFENETIERVDVVQVGGSEDDGTDRYDLTVNRTTTTQSLVIEPIAPEDFRYAANWSKTSLEGIRFCARRMTPTRSDLLDEGISQAVVARLPTFTSQSNATENARRQGVTYATPTSGQEWAQQQVEVWRCWVRTSQGAKSASALWQVDYAGHKVIRDKQVPFIPLATGTTNIRPYRPEGISDFDRLKQIQDGKTGALREWADNLHWGNVPRVGVIENQVNLLDYAQGKPYVRIKAPNAISPLPVRDIGASSEQFMGYMDRMRSERGGASLDLQSAEAQIAGHTAHGTERQYSAREMTTKLKSRTFAETLVRQLAMLVHRTMRTFANTEIELKRQGEWQKTDPRKWSERSRLKVNLGASQAEINQRMGALDKIITTQTAAMQAGMRDQLVGLPNIHKALVDFANLAGLSAPDQYWIDPASEGAQKAGQQKQDQATKQAKDAEDKEKAILSATWALERYKTDVEYKFKYINALLDAEIEEAKITGDVGLQLQLQQARTAMAARTQTTATATSEAQATIPAPEQAPPAGTVPVQ